MMNIKEFTKLANKERLNNKNEWVLLNELIIEPKYNEPLKIQYKAFGNWIQVLIVNGKKLSSNMDLSVTEFKYFINNSLTLELIFNNDELNILN